MINLNADLGKIASDLVGGLAGAAGGAGGILSMASKTDPMSMVIDTIGKSLGLPSEVCGIAKIAAGAYTGNVMAIAGGAGDVLGAVAKDLPAMTEHFSGSLNAGIDAHGRGYASLEMQGKYGGLNAYIGRPLPNMDFIYDRIGLPRLTPLPGRPGGPVMERVPEHGGHVPHPGLINGVWNNPNSPLDPNIVKYRDAVETLAANYHTFETAHGAHGSGITRRDLANILANPNASPKLKEAAQFLMDNPEYFNRLEMAAGLGGKDGIIGKLDLQREAQRVSNDIARHGVALTKGNEAPPATQPTQPSPGTGSGSPVQTKEPGKTGASTDIQSILNDPTLSLEQKIMLILMKIMEDADKEIEGTLNELASTRTSMGEEKNKGDKLDHAKQAGFESSMERAQLRLQNLMEKRKRMFDLMTTISGKFHEMAKGAIQNMARA